MKPQLRIPGSLWALTFTGCAHTAAGLAEPVEPVASSTVQAPVQELQAPTVAPPPASADETRRRLPAEETRSTQLVALENTVATAARRLALAREELDRQYEEALARATQTGRHTKLSPAETRALTELFLERARRFATLASQSNEAASLADEIRVAANLRPSRSTVSLSLRLLQRAERLATSSR